MSDQSSDASLDLREQIVRIDKMILEMQRTHQKIRLAPWQVALAGMTSGAALFAAGAAFFRLLSP